MYEINYKVTGFLFSLMAGNNDTFTVPIYIE